MTEDQREIRRKKRVLEYAERVGNNNIACRRFGTARSTLYVWRARYQELCEAGLARLFLSAMIQGIFTGIARLRVMDVNLERGA